VQEHSHATTTVLWFWFFLPVHCSGSFAIYIYTVILPRSVHTLRQFCHAHTDTYWQFCRTALKERICSLTRQTYMLTGLSACGILYIVEYGMKGVLANVY